MARRRFGRHTVETSNEDKLLFPDDGLTKGDLMDYYEAVAPHLLPWLRERPLVLLGNGALVRADGPRVASLAAKVAVELGAVKDGWNGFGVLHTAASRVGAFDVGFIPGEGGHGVG